jgi:hypothetical protein
MRYEKGLALIMALAGLIVLARNNWAASDAGRYLALSRHVNECLANEDFDDKQVRDIQRAAHMDAANYMAVLNETRRDLLISELFSACAVLYGVVTFLRLRAIDKKANNNTTEGDRSQRPRSAN